MSCTTQVHNFIFNIEKISRSGKKVYIFVGDLENSLKKILKKIENKENIKDKNELNMLKQNFKKELPIWLKYIKDKIDIIFIYNLIRNNDNVATIRKKIFYYCSDYENNSFILPENQELWVINEKNNHEIIGFYYEDQNRNKIKTKPIIFQKFDTNKDHRQIKKFIINNSENNILIYDLIDFLGIKNNTIYFTDGIEYYNYITKNKKNINKNTLNYYLKKHFPYININYDLKNIKNDYLLKKKIFEKELLIENIFKKYKKDDNLVGDCNITYMIFKINEIKNTTEKENNIIPLDLYQIFDYLREKKIGNDIPFVKYGDESFNIPISLVSTDAINSNKINKNMINDWIGINKITTNINGIMVKKYLKDYNDECKYISLILRKNNEVTFKLSFDIDDKIDLHDISYSIKNSKKLIEDINKNLMSKKVDIKQKIDPPDIDIKNDIIQLKKNTNLKFCNIYIPLKKKININFNDLYEYSKKFPEYLYDEYRDLNNKNKQRFINNIKLRYKKVSGFIPMSDIIKDIDILKSKGENDNDIIQIISKKYSKTQDDVSNFILEWKKKYSSYMSSRIDSEYKIGVEIEISNNSIKLNQITNFYQINIIYNFVKNFLLMYINEKNNKNINNLINNKKLNIKIANDDDFIVSYNQKKKIENYNFNSNFIELDLIEDKLYQDIDNKKKTYESNEELSNNLGIASNDQIAPELRLKCDDAIPDQGRCADACNDPSYYLRRLQTFDNYLFRFPKKNNKQVQYSTRCGAAQGRQPIVLASDPADNPKIKKDAYTYSLKYSSKPEEFQRWYICPNMWCPACEIPLSKDEIDESTIQRRVLRRNGAQCITALCPYNNTHQVIIRETNQIYPGFIDTKHPDKYHCLPCCFAYPQNTKDYPQKYINYKKCLGEDVEEVNTKNGLIYILGKISPIEKDRYAILPAEVSRLLNTRLETGYLGVNKGYVKKGIKHIKNQSFISSLLNIISCIENNINVDEKKLKKLLIEKLDIDLFRSLYNGNLEIVFNDPKHNLTAIQNFKKYLSSDEVIIDHKYLWDYIQRENILYKNGVNLVIFENNNILCPNGENVIDYYDNNKKTILLLKSDNYYEPIYYLEGDGKSAVKKCLFNSELIEIKKLFEIIRDGCVDKFDINWTQVLKNNIDFFNLKVDNITYKYEYELLYTIKELVEGVSNNKLKNEYLPKIQYVDNYNKVFAIVLNNNLYIPVKPSGLLNKIKYKVVYNLSTTDLLDYKDILKKTAEINKNTKLNYTINHKILDNKDKKYIIAIINNNNRIIPVKKVLNKDKILKISNTKYFNDINEFITQKIIMNDKRIEKINKKNFEDETFNRLRYELSIFLQKNKKYLDKIKSIISDQNQYNNKSLGLSRKKMYLVLDEIFKKISTTKDKKINYFEYKIPNKRIPCWMRNTESNKKNNYKTIFKCESDPHCVNEKKKCKLFINKNNLIELFKSIKNYPYYLSKLLDELLRFKIKREEILNNDIDNIINKNYVPTNDKKYIILQTYNIDEIKTKIDQVFFNNYGIYLDIRKLYEESSTKKYAFNKNLYLKDEYKNSNNNIIFNNLSIFWTKILGNKFKIKNKILNAFEIFKEAIKSNKNFYMKNKELDIITIKNDLVKYWHDIIKDSRDKEKSQELIYKNYKDNCARKIKNILNFEDLMIYILNNEYKGCFLDFKILSKIYNLNLVFLEKRIKKNNDEGFHMIKSDKSNYYILIYESIINNQSIYNLVGSKNKYLFYLDELTPKFIQNILKIN